MLTRKEREVLKQASKLITRELLAGEGVGIHHFGRFYTTELDVATRLHKRGEDVMPDKPTKRVHVVRFRAWEQLKKKLHAMPTNGEGIVEQIVETSNAIVNHEAEHGQANVLAKETPTGLALKSGGGPDDFVAGQPDLDDDGLDEQLPFCPHCGEDFGHLLVNPKTCPTCGLPPELDPNDI